MARICIIHWSFSSSLGGAEKLCIETIRALEKAGHDVDLVAISRLDHRLLRQRFATDARTNNEIAILPSISLPTIYSVFMNWFLRDIIMIPYLKRNYQLTINTGPLLPISFTDLMYLQDYPGRLQLYGKYRKGVWRAYSLLHDIMIDVLVGLFNRIKKMPILLTNSLFNKWAIENYLHGKAYVLYPPVQIDDHINLSKISNRENIVLTISRIDESKGLDLVPRIAERTSDAKFVIIGSLGSERCLHEINSIIRNLQLIDRVVVVPNVSEEMKKILLSKAKIYLHTSQYEPFGISVVEAMASGLVPLVYKSGGPWIDILCEKQGVYGYGYEDVRSCANLVNDILNDDSLRMQVVQRSIERSKIFEDRTFRKNLVMIVEEALRLNSLTDF